MALYEFVYGLQARNLENVQYILAIAQKLLSKSKI